MVSTSLFCLFCAIQHYYHTFLDTASLFCLLCTIQHYYNTFIWSLLHYFVYSVPFNITTISFFGLYFTILFTLYHSTLLQYLFLVSTSLFCLFCAIQHYYNTFFRSLLHYFVYSVPFNITTIPFLGLYFTILFTLYQSTLLQYLFWPLLHYFVYSVPFNITTIPLFGLYFTILLILCHSTLLPHLFGHCFTILFTLYHSTLLQYLYLVSTSLFCLFCAIQHYYNTFFWPLLHYFVYSVPFNITTIPLFGLYFTILFILCHSTLLPHLFGHCFTILFILYHSTLLQYLYLVSTSLFCLLCTIQHCYNTFIWSLLHYFVYSVPFNITTIPLFGLYFTILFTLYHSTLLQYFYLVCASLFCLLCTIQHYYNTFIWSLLHYFVYSVPFNITTIPLFGLYFTILFILYHSTLLQYLYLVSTSLFCLFCAIQHYYNTFIWSLLHYFVYSVPFNITTIPFFGLYFTILLILYHSTLLQYLCLASTSLFCLYSTIQHYYNTFFGLCFTILFILCHSTLLQYLYLVSTSLFCLFCTIQHYYNTFFWPLLHYFVYTVPFNITTTPFFGLYFIILFILYHSTLLKYPFWPLLHYFAYSVPFNITTIPFLASTSLFCLFCTIQHYYNTLFGHCFTILFILYHSTLLQYPFWQLLHYFAYSLPFNITTIAFLATASLFCLFSIIQHYYNTFFGHCFTILLILYHSTLLQYPFWPLLHNFAYSLPFNITTIPCLATASLFCLFCTIQHYYNTLFGHCFTILPILYHLTLLQYPFWPLLHYFAYSVPFNITIPFLATASLFCLFSTIQHYYNTLFGHCFTVLFILYQSTLLQYLFWPLLHYFAYSLPFNITTIPFFCLYFTTLFILYHSTLLQYLFLASASLFCLFCAISLACFSSSFCFSCTSLSFLYLDALSAL